MEKEKRIFLFKSTIIFDVSRRETRRMIWSVKRAKFLVTLGAGCRVVKLTFQIVKLRNDKNLLLNQSSVNSKIYTYQRLSAAYYPKAELWRRWQGRVVWILSIGSSMSWNLPMIQNSRWWPVDRNFVGLFLLRNWHCCTVEDKSPLVVVVEAL